MSGRLSSLKQKLHNKVTADQVVKKKVNIMGVAQKVKHEIVTIVSLTLYFLAWLGFLMLLKFLLLSDFQIEFTGFSIALVGALVLAKVVLIPVYIVFWYGDIFREKNSR